MSVGVYKRKSHVSRWGGPVFFKAVTMHAKVCNDVYIDIVITTFSISMKAIYSAEFSGKFQAAA